MRHEHYFGHKRKKAQRMRWALGFIGVSVPLCMLLAGCGAGNGNGNGNGNGEAVLTSITIAPAASTVAVGGTVDFTATGRDQWGGFFAMTATWVVEGGIGALGAASAPNDYTSTVRFTATAAGTGTVRVSCGGIVAEATVTVTEGGAPPVLTLITMIPPSASVQVGETLDIIAAGYDQYGRLIAFDPTFGVSCVPGPGGLARIGSVPAANVILRFTALAEGSCVVHAVVGDVRAECSITVTAPGGGEGLTNLFFLHHSVGLGIVDEGGVRAHINAYNTTHGTSFAFWDHGYNWEGLRNPAGVWLGTNYDIPGEDTTPAGLHALWTTSNSARAAILANHEVIAFKSCFPASAIGDAWALNEYKQWYREMRDFFDTRPDRLFVVMSPPPLHRLSTNTTEADNARAFANWLKSAEYLSGHPNVVCFDLFNMLARTNDGSATRNMLRYEYEMSHSDGDSHPNTLANETVGPIFAQFLVDVALAY